MTMRFVWVCLFLELFFVPLGSVSLAASPENPSPEAIYANGRGWQIFANTKAGTCLLFASFRSSALLAGSDSFDGAGHYTTSFMVDGWNPTTRYVNYEIKNQDGLILKAKARVHVIRGQKYTKMFVDRKFLRDLEGSTFLRVTTDIGSIDTYDLAEINPGFTRLQDCLKEVEPEEARPSSSPSRRMN